ncbi:MAG: twin transmembrane helix small protein [Pseudomonadota bacterium]
MLAQIPFILMAIAMIATVAVLATGLYAMIRGGDFNAKWSNKLMRLRILVQGIAVLLFMLGLWLRSMNL